MSISLNSVSGGEKQEYTKLTGNLAPKGAFPCWEIENERKDQLRGTVFCCSDADAFLGAVKNGKVKENTMLLYANSLEDSVKEQEMACDAVVALAEKGLSASVILFTNKKWLLKKRDVCRMVYLKEAGGWKEPFLFARTNDSLSLDLKDKTLFLYVTDLEMTFRKWEQ